MVATVVSRLGQTSEVRCGASIFPSDLGWMGIAFRGDCLTRITFGHPSSASVAASLGNATLIADERELPPAITKTIERLQRFAAGKADDFLDVRLDLSELTEFQLRVVKACRKIKAGQSKSYGDLALIAGSPRAARAVGNVMRNNRYPLIVPCHRVIASNGKLCGFTCPEGLAMKERLLEREGVLDKPRRKAK